jgi:hypothetical protein
MTAIRKDMTGSCRASDMLAEYCARHGIQETGAPSKSTISYLAMRASKETNSRSL